jgi:hypothetical protein
MNRNLLAASGVALLALMTPTVAAPPDDTIVLGLSADASTFDPPQISSRDNSNIARHIFATLFNVTLEGEIEPYLAQETSISQDGRAYTFTLPADFTCEDGEPLTAEDVAYSFNRAADPDNGFTGNTPGFVFTTLGFESAEVVDEFERHHQPCPAHQSGARHAGSGLHPLQRQLRADDAGRSRDKSDRLRLLSYRPMGSRFPDRAREGQGSRHLRDHHLAHHS